jgi:hypothetical protein
MLAATALRLPLALAAGELVAGGPRRWAPAAGVALPAAVLLLWPGAMVAALGADRLTLYAAAACLVAARWLPARLRRLALAAGLVLAALFLARAGAVSHGLGTVERVPGPPLEP